jgi:hypothetical protein
LRRYFINTRLAARLEHLARDGGDGDRRVLQTFFAERCGNRHLFERACFFFLSLGDDLTRGAKSRERRTRKQ